MKRILYILAIVIAIVIINNLAHSIYDLWSKKDVVVSANKELEKEKKENQYLKTQLNNAQKGGFIEEEARNKLLLVKPGEEQLIIPRELTASESSKIKIDNRPNWQKWWDLFF